MKYLDLNDRSKFILKAIIEGYINSAEPVGSRTVSKKNNIDLSPASIRNIMADLEDLNYIEQPHTSAGRVPTDKGYRFFVDELSSVPKLNKEEISLIKNEFGHYGEDMETVLEVASRVLSMISHQTGVVHYHKLFKTNFKHIELIKIDTRQILVVFVSDAGIVQHKIVEIEEDLSREKVIEMSNYLNEEFINPNIELIKKKLIEKMDHEKAEYNKLLKKAIDLTNNGFLEQETETMYLEGVTNIFDQPEFTKNADEMKKIFKAFEDKSKIIKILNKCMQEEGTNVIIGSEIYLKEMGNCSMITHTYKQGDKILGSLGIIGLRRMEYPKIIALVEYVSGLVTDILSKR